jgi:hypothetical protein
MTARRMKGSGDMADVPVFVLQNCIDWNAVELSRAERDAADRYVTVPKTATKRIWSEGKALNVRLTPEEYRVVRLKDAARLRSNIQSLRQRIAA